MTPVETAIADVRRWIDSIDREKDEHLQRLSRVWVGEVERVFIGARLEVIAAEHVRACESLRKLEALRFLPETSFRRRPKWLKAGLRSMAEKKRA